MKSPTLLLHVLAAALTVSALGGCAAYQTASAEAEAKPKTKMAASPAASAPTEHFFIVYHENGRIYPIADVKNYLTFLETDELMFTRTRIGAGLEGETIVFGIEKNEADNPRKPSKAELFFDGKYTPTGPFYGEIVRDGRIYVFGSWADFKDFMVNKEVAYTYTEIGAGPKGETVIYALNKETAKKGRPVELIEAFKALRKK